MESGQGLANQSLHSFYDVSLKKNTYIYTDFVAVNQTKGAWNTEYGLNVFILFE